MAMILFSFLKNCPLILLSLFVFSEISFGQENKENKEWINIGFGFNSPPSQWGSGLALEGQYNFGKEKYYQVNLRHTRKHVMGGKYLLQTLGFQRGIRKLRKWYLGAIFTGPSIIWGEVKNDKNDYEKKLLLGWEGNLQFFFRAPIFPEFGIGIMSYLSLNQIENHYGVQFSLLMGNGK